MINVTGVNVMDTIAGLDRMPSLFPKSQSSSRLSRPAGQTKIRVWLKDVIHQFSSTLTKEIDSLSHSKLEVCRFSAGLITSLTRDEGEAEAEECVSDAGEGAYPTR